MRKIPRQFSWIDHRLVREGYIEQCSHSALALYLFLLTVGDSKGLSYYSEPSLMKRLSMDEINLKRSRQELIYAGLIAYQEPVYQVLALDYRKNTDKTTESPKSFSDILKKLRQNHD